MTHKNAALGQQAPTRAAVQSSGYPKVIMSSVLNVIRDDARGIT
jgi:hypothetical protein